MKERHKTQIGILNKLLFSESLNYSDLKIDKEIENNTFQFHLNKVINDRLVKKDNQGMYSLTIEGKKLANYIDTDKNKLLETRKISVHLYCIREKGKELQTLMYTRKKQPFYGKQGFPAGKVMPGEKFPDAAKRELNEETNLVGDPTLFNILHYLVKDKVTKELLDDKLFLDFFIKNPSGELVSSIEGDYKWINVKDLSKEITNPFDNIGIYETALERIKNFKGVINFEEKDHFTNDF